MISIRQYEYVVPKTVEPMIKILPRLDNHRTAMHVERTNPRVREEVHVY